MDHYEVLGVPRHATTGEIKQAYIAKAKICHPDKGGAPGEFEAILAAYTTLKDPDARAVYDKSGNDGLRPLEEQAQGILLTMFQAAIAAPTDRRLGQVPSIIDRVRASVNAQLSTIAGTVKRLEKDRAMLTDKRDRISCKREVNLAHVLIDQEVRVIDSEIAANEYDREVRHHCLQVLEDYEETEPPRSEEPALSIYKMLQDDLLKQQQQAFERMFYGKFE